MNKRIKLQTIAAVTYAVVFMLVSVFAIYMYCAEHNSVYRARTAAPCEVLEDYNYTTVEDSSAPAGIRKVYRFTLSDIAPSKDHLAFYVVHHYVEVRIDGEPVYKLTVDENNRVGISPGSDWVFVALEGTDNGKEAQITLTPVFQSVANRETEFLLGSRSDIVLKQLRSDFPQIALSVLFVFMGIILMIMQTFMIFQKKSASWDMFYLGNLLFLIGIWRITDTRSSPFLFPENTMALGYITLAALFIAFAPLLLFLKDRFSGRKKTSLLICLLVMCIIALGALICQVFHIAELRQTLLFCHAILIVSMAVLVLVSLVHFDKKSSQVDLRGMVLLMAIGAIADFMFFYLKKSSSGLVFTISALLLYTLVRAVSGFFNMNRKANVDAQTGLFNRSRWNDIMEDPKPFSEGTGVMMLDLNRLKYTNDTMGHEMGDKLIFGFAEILRAILPSDCMIFRWGGDEFTVLVSDADRDKMERYVSGISSAVEAYNASGEKPEIHYAVGYALSDDYPALSREQLTKKADEKMYRNKNEWYHKHLPDHHIKPLQE